MLAVFNDKTSVIDVKDTSVKRPLCPADLSTDRWSFLGFFCGQGSLQNSRRKRKVDPGEKQQLFLSEVIICLVTKEEAP